MQNAKTRIIYSLRVHLGLKRLGFEPVETLPNYQREGFVCWVYEVSPAFQEALDSLLGGASNV